MARPTVALIRALRTTAIRLQDCAVVYRWSRYGQCNCGHLAQTITGLINGAYLAEIGIGLALLVL